MTHIKTELQNQVSLYTTDLLAYFRKYDLFSLLKSPLDHIALKAQDKADFENILSQVEAISDELSYIYMCERRLANARLKNPIDLSPLGRTFSLEVIEPKPDKAGNGKFDHCEIYTPDLDKIAQILISHSVSFTPYQNPHHKALVVIINDKEQEVKFTNSKMDKIVKMQITSGESIVLK